MKSITYIFTISLLMFLSATLGQAQLIPRGANIVAAEYFVGSDPGVGNGTPITVTTPGLSVDFQINSLSLPLNQIVYVRCKDANNRWSVATPYRFRGFGNNRSVDITRAEYFIGADPGMGNGTAINLTSGPNPSFEALNIPLLHGQIIWTRARDADGRWSSPVPYTFKGYGNNRSIDITRAEYFIGSDPGQGNGTAISVTPGPNPTFEALDITLPIGQRIWTRARDADGRWSRAVPYTFRGYGNNRSMNVTQAEYFIGSDPGPGNGTAISISPGPNPSFEVPNLSLFPGQRISTRVREADGKWSNPVARSYPNEIVIRAELSSPQPAPPGTGTPMIASDGNFNSAVEAIEGTLTNWNRIDSIWIRVQSSNYYWSFPLGDNAVHYPPVGLTSISPTSGSRLQTLFVTMNGSNFIRGVTTADFGPNITIDSVVVLSASQLRAYITISSAAATGQRDVSVSNPSPGGGTATLSNAFTVNNPAPIVTSISPASGNRLQILNDTLNGSNFISGVTTVTYGTGITVNSTPLITQNRMVANITISALAPTGQRRVYVTNSPPGGGIDSSRTFTVNNPAPTFTSVSPDSGYRLQTLNVTVVGNNFISGVTTVDFGQGISLNSLSITSSSQLTAMITISDTAATGARTVSITNAPPGGGTATFTFRVNNPLPTLTSISPTSGERLQRLNVGFKGSNFIAGVSTANVGTGITIHSTTVHSPDTLTVDMTIGATAATGPRNFSVTNSGPGGGTSPSQTFSINNPPPNLTSISPVAGNRLDTINLAFRGTNFVTGVTQPNVGSGITIIPPLIFSGDTSLTARIFITVSADTGARNFSVTNPSPGGGTSGSQVFTVYNPAPVLDTISPTEASRGQTLNLTLRGRKFIQGVSFVNINPAGITIDSTTVNNDTHITARITVSPSATLGPYAVSVTNLPPGGGTTGAVTFNLINNAPTAPMLISPGHGDTIQLFDPPLPINFAWRSSMDPDPLDTLNYTLTLWGVSWDTLITVASDTVLSFDVMGRLQVASDYWWTVRVTDGIVTVFSPDTFLFRTSNNITDADLLSDIPKEYRMFQNYPNPFNPSTTIRYELPVTSRVFLKIYNVLGQEVATLVDEVKQPGRYTTRWDASNVASGVYFYRLLARPTSVGQAGSFVETKKLILLR